ncbi:MAG: aminopeptidase [Bacteroidales bacterium]|nr:aminopeptidase [Bacteroidales bacterium]
MKNYFKLTSLAIILLFASYSFQIQAQSQPELDGVIIEELELYPKLLNLPGVEVIKVTSSDVWKEFYSLKITQYVDHKKQKDTFTQRVFVGHRGLDNNTLLITEGYGAQYASNPNYNNELSDYLNSNQITIEHRYFLESVPKQKEWKYLTVANAAADHHHIVELLKPIYENKWINTGISKGGQTSIYHRYHYPEDVDVTVGYVCPLNFGPEDKRVYTFLQNVGPETKRDSIFSYQKIMLEQKAEFMPIFEDYCAKNHLNFKISLEAAYEFCILEYSFAYWQWGSYAYTAIPSATSDTKYKFDHLMKISSPDYFSTESHKYFGSFFYQAFTEIGYYGYDIKPFGDLVVAIKDHNASFHKPDGGRKRYKYSSMKKVNKWLEKDADHMMFIYGEYDPWSSTAVDVNNTNLKKYVKPEGSHATRIANMPDTMRNEILGQLQQWLND